MKPLRIRFTHTDGALNHRYPFLVAPFKCPSCGAERKFYLSMIVPGVPVDRVIKGYRGDQKVHYCKDCGLVWDYHVRMVDGDIEVMVVPVGK